LAFLAALISAGRLDPLLGATASWTRMPEVLDGLKARKFSGKAGPSGRLAVETTSLVDKRD
jgi:hypothetical protein